MSNLLSRKHNFIRGELIRAGEWTDELEQLYQFFSGVLSGKIIVNQSYGETLKIINSGISVPVVDIKKLNTLLIRMSADITFSSLVTLVAPFSVTSKTKVANLNAEFLGGIPASGFFLTGKVIDNWVSFYFDGIALTTDEIFRFITPAGTAMSIKEFKVSSAIRTGAGSYPSNDATATIDLKKNGVVIDTASLGITTFSYDNAALNIGVVENDVISCHVTSNNGIDKCRNISAKFRLRQTLVA